MTQIDLGCSSLAPALTGLLFAYLSQEAVSIVLLAVNACAVLALYVFMSHLYSAWPALGQKAGVDDPPPRRSTTYGAEDDSRDAAGAASAVTVPNTTNDPLDTMSYGTSDIEMVQLLSSPNNGRDCTQRTDHTYLQRATLFAANTCTFNVCDFIHSGCAGMMVAYAMLYMTVLSFGSLMTVYTRYCGVSDARIGLFRGLAALSGYLGAVIFPLVSDTFGKHSYYVPYNLLEQALIRIYLLYQAYIMRRKSLYFTSSCWWRWQARASSGQKTRCLCIL